MFCSQCGFKLDEDAKFCSKCGYKLENNTEQIIIKSEELKPLLFKFDGEEYDIVSMHQNNEFKNDKRMFDDIAFKHKTSRKRVLEELEFQKGDIIGSVLQVKGFVDEEDKTIVCGIPVIDRLQKAKKGAKEIDSIYKSAIASLDKSSNIHVFIKEYIIYLANEYKIKGTHDGPMMCPKCGSIHIETHKKGFGAGKAVVGGLLMGPLGLAAGGIGSGKLTYHCQDCGYSAKGPGTFKVSGC